jgi:hypothetical protein
MKKTILTIALCACALCVRADLFGLKYNSWTTNTDAGVPVASTSIAGLQPGSANLTNVANGNLARLTNATGLRFTNSAAGILTSGSAYTVPDAGFLTVSVMLTNSQIVWLTNSTTHACLPMGNLSGVWTNWGSATLLCNFNDVVLVTNISGTGGATLINSWFQSLQ